MKTLKYLSREAERPEDENFVPAYIGTVGDIAFRFTTFYPVLYIRFAGKECSLDSLGNALDAEFYIERILADYNGGAKTWGELFSRIEALADDYGLLYAERRFPESE